MFLTRWVAWNTTGDQMQLRLNLKDGLKMGCFRTLPHSSSQHFRYKQTNTCNFFLWIMKMKKCEWRRLDLGYAWERIQLIYKWRWQWQLFADSIDSIWCQITLSSIGWWLSYLWRMVWKLPSLDVHRSKTKRENNKGKVSNTVWNDAGRKDIQIFINILFLTIKEDQLSKSIYNFKFHVLKLGE